ncbi:MAG: SufD family Fe-S cluster assembly protein [Deltaproteobacteria bacterium]|nr:SufD family Fe-S cluster assembly protein [Deltaproteobacteria bacterium]
MYHLSPEQEARARQALEKESVYGAPVDFAAYVHDRQAPAGEDFDRLVRQEEETLTKAGFAVDERQRAASFLQVNHAVSRCRRQVEGVEVLPTREALAKYDGLPDYWWQAVPVDGDKYTAKVALEFDNGYFIRARSGVKASLPVQTCMFMEHQQVMQNVHNLIIVEEGAELEIISGCATASTTAAGLHLGVSEIYVGKNARLTFTMIHNWGEEVVTRPRSAAWVEAGGVFISNYICLKKVQSLQMYPTARLRGPGATVRFNSIVAAPAGASLDMGSRVILAHPGCKAEVISRAVSFGGEIIARGHLVGEDPGVKAHLECHGLMLSDRGLIHAIPELEGRVAGVEMSHEAAVGKIAQEEVEYLMARGLDEEEATSTIVRGFLNVEIAGLPAGLRRDLDELLAKSNAGGL